MAVPNVHLMQLYRKEPGDLRLPDLPVAEDQQMNEALKRTLLGQFNDRSTSPFQRPHHARIVTKDGLKTIVTMMATGPSSVEIVPAQAAE
jgi:hypothetical protein